MDGIFAGTPPLEAKKALFRMAVTSFAGKRTAPSRGVKKLLFVDVRRAYFYAPARRERYIQIPAEDRMPGDEDKVGVLDFSLYGTRDATQNWAHCYTKVLVQNAEQLNQKVPQYEWQPQKI